MIKEIEFDYVHDVQSAFRKLLDAFSFPFKVVNLEDEVNKLKGNYKNLLLLSLILVDGNTRVLSYENDDLLRDIKSYTSCISVKDNPDFLFLPLTSYQNGNLENNTEKSGTNNGITNSSNNNFNNNFNNNSKSIISKVLELVNPGYLGDPHISTTLIVEVENILGDVTSKFKGPGIKGEKLVGISNEVYSFLCERDFYNFEYPMGVDFIFIDKVGNLIAVSRKVLMEDGK